MLVVAFYVYASIYILLGLVMCILSYKALRFARSKTEIHSQFPYPKVSLIKPVKSANASTEANFRSWLEQKYPVDIEFIFSFQDPADPALPLVRELTTEYSHLKIQTLINSVREGFSGKTSNLFYGVEASANEFVIMSDADIFAYPDAVREIVLRAEKEKTVVSCLPLHYGPEGIWAQMYLTLWNAVIVGLWGPLMIRTHPPGLSGGTVGFFRCDLDRIGGVSSFASYIAEDIKKGVLFKSAGYNFKLGPVVECKVGFMRFRQCWNAFMRGAYVSWNNEHGGLLPSVALNIFAYSYVVLLPLAILTGHKTAVPLFLVYVARVLSHSYFNWLAKNRFNFAFHTYMCDVMTICAYIYSLLNRRLEWAGVQYAIHTGGRFEKLKD